MHKQIFYKAILDSWNFHFEAYAINETLAKGLSAAE